MDDSDSQSASSSSESEVEEIQNDADRAKIRSEISTMSFEELMKLKEKLGSKVYSETVFGQHKERTKSNVRKDFKRDNKNRPREMGAKRPVPLLGNAKAVHRKLAAETTTAVRDPRFDPKCGEFDARKFKDNFAFVDEIKQRELVELRDRLKHSDDFKEQKKMKYLIQRMQNQDTEARKLKAREQMRNEEKAEIVTARKEGKAPRYRSERERKAQELVKQYLDLKESGKLNKHLEKRRKKNAVRDRKKFSFD